MQDGVVSVVPEQSVLSAAQVLRSKNVGAAVVLRDENLLGIISERDMLSKVLSPGLDPRDVIVGQIMAHELTMVSPDETWEECLNKMRGAHCRHLPVVEKGRVMGMLSLRDVLGRDEEEVLDTYLWDRFSREEEGVSS